MSISAFQVKELRERTGAGMMDCKSALVATDGDMQAALDWLRKNGITRAAIKGDRVACDGLVGVFSDGRKAVLVELNVETDFVARNSAFQELVRNVSQAAFVTDGSMKEVYSAAYPGGITVSDAIKEAVYRLGEDIILRRVAMLSPSKGIVANYVHNRISDGLGKIGVLVSIDTDGDQAAAHQFGHQLAMHVAARNPLFLNKADVDPLTVKRERSFFLEQVRQSRKSEAFLEKMVEGRLDKFYEEVVFLSQAFVHSPHISVESALRKAESLIGASAKISSYIRFALGDGIEKKEIV
ncbi:MAG: elongation factor Ts [Candidatus Tokpelaia sp. JSC161]|jgi:elongation factor Ts|nr:MAG: elongation factor Ts [Candidatus Tokpelaia sp. JSC161]